ncbi:MAG: peptidoglycan-binding protein, partial [Patescibacteria group bacterium]
FNRNLFLGLRNDPDVIRLQNFLRSGGFFAYPESTGNFFAVTQQAVIQFQQTHNISPRSGYVGSITRAKINEIIATGSGTTSPLEDILFPPNTDDPFPYNLATGMRENTDVIRLQEILRSLGFFPYPTSTGNYFSFTGEGVKKYQLMRRIAPADGEFKGLTRFTMNHELLAGIIEADGDSNRVDPVPQTATSTWNGKIAISRFSGKSTDPLNESITLTNKTKIESIDISGWYLETGFGKRATIPLVYNLPGLPDSSLQRLTVPPGGTITITAGEQSKRINFRENMCTGYFAEQSDFKPSLSRRCPRVDTEKLAYTLDDKCLLLLPKIGACKVPTQSQYFAQSAECTDYMIQNLNYAGCVRNYRNDEKFYSDKWFIWLQRSTSDELFRNIHDSITLYDSNGKFVDMRAY